MTITNGYCTLSELRSWLEIPAADTSGDTELEAIVTGVSRWIDRYCHRLFNTATSTSVRYYMADQDDRLTVDDLVSIVSLKTDDDGDRVYETTWSATDYDLLPHNAGAFGMPYTEIQTAENGTKAFSEKVKKGVQITAYFGYGTSVPPMVRQACLIQSARIWKRKDAILGEAGVTQFGVVTLKEELDADVRGMLGSFVRYV